MKFSKKAAIPISAILLVSAAIIVCMLCFKEKTFDEFYEEMVVYEEAFMAVSPLLIGAAEDGTASEYDFETLTDELPDETLGYAEELFDKGIVYNYRVSLSESYNGISAHRVYYSCYSIESRHYFGVLYIDYDSFFYEPSIPISGGFVAQRKINDRLYAYEYFQPGI